jgi:hypothetical protein
VHKNIVAAGIAIRKLNETAAALSFKPTLFIWWMKNIVTSYNGTRSKPGRMIFLLFA